MYDEGAQLIACIPRLRRYARALVGDRASADDLVQDTLERAWNKRSFWRRGSDLRAWLFSIMHNLHVDQMRRPSLHVTPLDDETLEIPAHSAHMSLLEVRDIQTALMMLPDEQREILLLVALEEMTYEEVAKALSIPLGTVMSRLARGREKLRTLMDGRPLASPLKVVK